ncbi:MAG: nuclear transport factor 2 family protein [bacterium]|jgi:ketosteroid isomerase-like protein|nr:nuclear transport factor 2 family protein [bacterium]
MDNETLVLDLFVAIENRDLQRILQIYDPDVEFHWPPALPYGGSTTGYQADTGKPSWQSIWPPLQPEPSDRRMDPRVIASGNDEVAVVYHQRGRDSLGRTFDGEVLGLYRVIAGKLKRAQMFYFDEQACVRFLEKAVMPGA